MKLGLFYQITFNILQLILKAELLRVNILKSLYDISNPLVDNSGNNAQLNKHSLNQLDLATKS